MNRRSYIKTLFGVGTVSLASFSVFKWISINKSVSPVEFKHKRLILAELVEIIIPETDTPGAKKALVHDYIIDVLINCNTVKQQRKFFNGLEDLEKYALKQYGVDFLKCTNDQRMDVISYFEHNSGFSFEILNKINRKILGDPFYFKLKSLTIEGYFTSKIGASEALAYDYIPGVYEACVPLRNNQKSWATK